MSQVATLQRKIGVQKEESYGVLLDGKDGSLGYSYDEAIKEGEWVKTLDPDYQMTIEIRPIKGVAGRYIVYAY
jgi:hypothetical protein